MSKEPVFPKDAEVEGPPASQAAVSAATAKSVDPKRRAGIVKTSVAVGIGSAAIVAALLYANRSRKNER